MQENSIFVLIPFDDIVWSQSTCIFSQKEGIFGHSLILLLELKRGILLQVYLTPC